MMSEFIFMYFATVLSHIFDKLEEVSIWIHSDSKIHKQNEIEHHSYI